jgi:hypothetical protein
MPSPLFLISVLVSMSIGKAIFSAFSLFIISVSCQYDINTLNLINATQTLHDLERYGHGHVQHGGGGGGAQFHPNIYPSLPNTVIDNTVKNQSGAGNTIPTYLRTVNVTRPSIEKFINKTMSTIPSGACIKEVP